MSALAVLTVVLAALAWPVGRDLTGRRGFRALRPVRSARRRRSELGALADAAAIAELLAMALRSGGTRHRAVEVVVPDAPPPLRPLLRELADELGQGRGGSTTWARWAAADPRLDACAAAWRLSEQCGVPLAPALEQAARTARTRLTAARRLEAATAGARATMLLLTVLPVVGLLAAWALGVSPTVAAGSPPAAASLLVGAVLTGLGWVSGRAILRRAVRPGAA